MNSFKGAALLCSFLIIALIPSDVFTDTEGKFVLGYCLKTLYDIDIKDGAAALDILSKELGKTTNFKVISNFYEEIGPFKKDFREGNLDFGILKSLDYLNMRNELGGEIALAPKKWGKVSQKFLLLVRSDSPFSDIRDLRNKKLFTIKGDEIGMLFLNTLLLKYKQPEMERFFSIIEERKRPSQVILPIFFGQADACITTDASFKTMIELNPQIMKRLKVIASSEDIILGVGFFREDYNERYKKIVLNTLLTLQKNARGRQLLLLFKSDSFDVVRESDLEPLKKLVYEYKRLKG